MNTAAKFKVRTIQQGIKQGMKPRVQIRGGAEVAVSAVKSLGYALSFTLDRGKGFMVIDPADMLSVWLPRPLSKPEPEDESQFEAHIDD